MTKSEMIQNLYNEINRQNTMYITIISLLVGLFALFQWVVNEKRLNNTVERKINKMVVDKYRLDEVALKSFAANDFMEHENKIRGGEAARLFNVISSLINLVKKMENKSDAQSIVIELILDNVAEMKYKSNDYPVYKQYLRDLDKYINGLDDSTAVIKMLKNIINLTLDPSRINEIDKNAN